MSDPILGLEAPESPAESAPESPGNPESQPAQPEPAVDLSAARQRRYEITNRLMEIEIEKENLEQELDAIFRLLAEGYQNLIGTEWPAKDRDGRTWRVIAVGKLSASGRPLKYEYKVTLECERSPKGRKLATPEHQTSVAGESPVPTHNPETLERLRSYQSWARQWGDTKW